MEISLLILILLSYFFGSIPFGYILPKLFGFDDIRNIGSGNIGTTNVLRTGNKTLALIVLLLDVLKGFFPLIIIQIFFIKNFSELIILLIGSTTILGHIFPIWLKFKGGKGVATYIGYLLAANYFLGMFFILSWLIIAILKRYSSLASILTLIILPIFSLLFSYEKHVFYLFSIISLLIIFKHYSNIIRLINKVETKIKF